MAGPSIVVRVLGDVAGLAKSIQAAGSAASGVAKSLHSAFSGTLSALNSTGVLGPFGDALAGIDQAIERVSGHAKSIGPAMMAIGGGLAAVGVGLAAVGTKDQAAHQQLQAAVTATGRDYEDYGKSVEAAIKHQERFGNTANQTQDALRVLTQATGDPAKALQLLNTATDLAAAKHEDLSTAATQLGKVYNGNAKLLKEFGITTQSNTKIQSTANTAQKQALVADNNLALAKRKLSDLQLIDGTRSKLTLAQQIQLRNAQLAVTNATVAARTAHQKLSDAQAAAGASAKNQGGAVAELATKLHGQAAAAADTFGGKLNALKARVEDAAATFGQKYGPAITAVGSGMAVLGGLATAGQGIFKSLAAAQKGAAAATDAVAASETVAEAAGAPLLLTVGLIVLGIAALVAIAYVLYRNWGTIWGGIKDAVSFVWDWIKSNWPLLLGILLGPIALAAALIYKYWSQILGGLQAVWHWIVGVWNSVYGYLTGPISSAVNWIVGAAGSVTTAFWDILNWMARSWTVVTGYITAPIQSAFNWVQTAIGTVLGWFSSLPGQIGNVLGGIVSIFSGPFKAAFNAIANIWNSTVGSLNFSIPSWVPGLGGKGFGMPKIPTLAQGGLITQTGIVFAHAGEVISPAPAARQGPAVVVEQATFNSDVDVESFMRKAAWVMQTAGV